MTDYILSIDPGLSTGVALLSYEPDAAPKLGEAWQFPGGVVGILEWLKKHHRAGWYDDVWGVEYAPVIRPSGRVFGDDLYLEDEVDEEWREEDEDPVPVVRNRKNVTIIAEKFTARNTRGFSYTTASLEPLRCEGALIALGLMPDYRVSEKRWRDPSLQYLVGGKDLADKRKRQHAFLKDIGFYRTGKQFGTPDADDARSAIAHGLAYLAREAKHLPSFTLMTEWTEGQ